MDWIERLFHLSPDGGSGSFELSVVIGALVAIAMIAASAVRLLPWVTRWYRVLQERSQEASPRALERFDG